MSNVKLFRSTDNGAPPMYGNAGYLISVLDACLVNGYGSQTPSSLTRAANGVVTCVVPVAHGLLLYSRQTIAGANESGFNGEYLITPTDAYTFTYQGTGGVATATGTITTMTSGAGWTKPFSGTQGGVYRGGSGNRFYLNVNDTTTITSRIVGYEVMTAYNTGTNPFPTASQVSGGLYFQKSSTADATNARPYIIIADDKTVYIWVNFNSSGTNVDTPMHAFGEFISHKTSDAYNTVICANTGATTATFFRFGYLTTHVQGSDPGNYVVRSHTQVGTSVPTAKISDYSKSGGQTNMGATPGLVYPHQVNGSLCMSPVWLTETAVTVAQSVIRGQLRGIWNPLHLRPLSTYDTLEGTGDQPGKIFLALGVQLTGLVMVDISLTWD